MITIFNLFKKILKIMKDSLLQLIRNCITENGNKEITGAKLQQILINMTNDLGESVRFIGEVQPDTEYTNTEHYVIALARTAGRYVNFGMLRVEDGESALLLYNGAWSKFVLAEKNIEVRTITEDGFYIADINGNIGVDFTANNTPVTPVTESDLEVKTITEDGVYMVDVNGYVGFDFTAKNTPDTPDTPDTPTTVVSDLSMLAHSFSKKLELRAFQKVSYNLENNSPTWVSNSTYVGVLIPVGYVGEYIMFDPTHFKVVAAFLTNNTITSGSTPNLCVGTEIIRLTQGSDKKVYEVPTDCTYIYVYVSNGSYYNDINVCIKPFFMETQKQRLYSLKKYYELSKKDWGHYSSHDLTTIAHISDLHEDVDRFKAFAEFCRKNNNVIDHAVCTGDYVNPANMTKLQNMISSVKDIYNINFTVGNHEKYADRVSATDAQIKSAMGLSSLYYAKDLSSKLKLIVLDQYDTPTTSLRNHDVHYSQTQINWLITQLKSATSSGRAVVIAFHRPESIPPENDKGFYQRYHQWKTLTNYYCSGTPVEDIVEAWRTKSSINKTYTYTDSSETISVNETFTGNNTFVAYICGHLHGDFVGYSSAHPNQLVLNITTGCCTAYNTTTVNYGGDVSDLPRIPNTYTENAFNVYGIDLVNKMVKIVRIGSDLNDLMEERQIACFPIK